MSATPVPDPHPASRPDPREVLARAAAPPDAVLRYGRSAESVVDLRLPVRAPGDAPSRLVVLLHGGFWRAEYDRIHTRPLADGLAAEGWAVATPEYPRTGQPGGGWPGTFDDVATALRSLPDLVEAVAPGAVDVGTPVLLGHSAGGQLALWAAATPSVRPPGLAGVVALAPVADLGTAWRLGLDGGAVTALLGGSPAEAPDRYAAVDPLRLPAPSVPVMVLHGTDDAQVPPSISEAYGRATGARVEVLAGVEHFGLVDPRSAAWPRLLEVLRTLEAPAAR
ncbi:MAG TPA: alpha/beta hydrolase [Jiangellales bacterium]|nr:alpha/beta hydrolase [Jiangellales bacterium]